MIAESPAELPKERIEHCFNADFKYTHSNPYHERLAAFDEFVLRDEEGESRSGKWASEIFKNNKPIHLEVGSGYGHFMLDFCEKNPDINFVGLDYRFKRSFQLAKRLSHLKNTNFRYLRAKGERVSYLFSENEVDQMYYFFPDPWPKTRHHKKRLFQMPFLESAYKILRPGGKFFVKTDHDGYAQWMKEFIEHPSQDKFKLNLITNDLHKEHPGHFLTQTPTKFEKIFLKKGINIKAFVLESLKV